VDLWGGTCTAGVKQMICTGVKTPNGRPMTIGDYVLYPGDGETLRKELENEAKNRAELRQRGIRSDIYGLDLLEHESNHSDQWAQYPYPPSFLVTYFAGTGYSYWTTGTDGDGNPWEIQANPYKGNYWQVPDYVDPPPFTVPEPPDMLGVKNPCFIGLWCWTR
jgi:hypothetical protein